MALKRINKVSKKKILVLLELFKKSFVLSSVCLFFFHTKWLFFLIWFEIYPELLKKKKTDGKTRWLC